jgi:diaminopimelate epimerase
VTAFTKMSGGGNDFVVLAQELAPPEADLAEWVRRVCRRGLSAGADGVLVLGASSTADMRLVHYNADGGRSSLCGNGTRCAARWTRRQRGPVDRVTLETDCGPVEAHFPSDEQVSILLPFACHAPQLRRVALQGAVAVEGYFVEVGIPHFVAPVESFEGVDVHETGGAIRRHAMFAPQGTNVSFMVHRDDGSLEVRTFERGVEAETLACGTACVAAAILAVERGWSQGPVVCHTRSGLDLRVELEAAEEGYHGLRLQGDARFIYEGRLASEALKWSNR